MYNKLTYFEYPHRTLSCLPTNADIQRIVEGTHKRGQNSQPPSSKREVLEYILQNWGKFDSAMMGELNVPLKCSIEGGLARGKVSLAEKVESLLDDYQEETSGSSTRLVKFK